ncbi:hypothetical protein, partial [Actinoplanes xinjiangensis]|uniref:hypothetical protein n=1 Tax=Actinoplanes xinjiangensis TaxID=512350 RepID=UPI0034244663
QESPTCTTSPWPAEATVVAPQRLWRVTRHHLEIVIRRLARVTVEHFFQWLWIVPEADSVA